MFRDRVPTRPFRSYLPFPNIISPRLVETGLSRADKKQDKEQN
jgi:hypothetical protein